MKKHYLIIIKEDKDIIGHPNPNFTIFKRFLDAINYIYTCYLRYGDTTVKKIDWISEEATIKMKKCSIEVMPIDYYKN